MLTDVKGGLCHYSLRHIGYRDPETKKQYAFFLINNFRLSAKMTAAIYKKIELYFR
jgi:hypothetical protein